VFLPTGSPHYRQPAVAPGEHRVAMLRLALGGFPFYSIDTRELASDATGYTVDTLRSLKAELPKDEMFLLMGSDQYSKFESWREPDEVARFARLAVAARPGFALQGRPAETIPFQPMMVSSSDIRMRAARGEDLSPFVPPSVAVYIANHGLYR